MMTQIGPFVCHGKRCGMGTWHINYYNNLTLSPQIAWQSIPLSLLSLQLPKRDTSCTTFGTVYNDFIWYFMYFNNCFDTIKHENINCLVSHTYKILHPQESVHFICIVVLNDSTSDCFDSEINVSYINK